MLNHDLQCLAQVRGAGATEATIFYAARILEMLAAAALDALNLPASRNLFANLNVLERYNLIPTATRYRAHALRRQGNDVRHICRAITFTDADLAIGFVQVVLHWFFCHFPMGPRLAALGDKQLSIDQELAPASHETLLAALGSDDADVDAWAELCLASGDTMLTYTPVVPAVLVERLLDREDYAHMGRSRKGWPGIRRRPSVAPATRPVFEPHGPNRRSDSVPRPARPGRRRRGNRGHSRRRPQAPLVRQSRTYRLIEEGTSTVSRGLGSLATIQSLPGYQRGDDRIVVAGRGAIAPTGVGGFGVAPRSRRRDWPPARERRAWR